MSVVSEETINSNPAPPPAAPSVDPTPAPPQVPDPAGDTVDQNAPVDIAAFNAKVEAELEAENAPAPPVEPVVEQPAVEEPAAEEEAPADETAAEGEEGGAAPAIEFSVDDEPEVYAEKKQAVLEAVDLSEAPAVAALLAHQDAIIAKQNETLTQVDGIANRETVMEFGSALNEVYRADVDPQTGDPIYNPTPIVEFFRNKMPDAYSQIAQEFLSADSIKFPGVSVQEEVLVEHFGLEKAQKMMAYAFFDQPLPVTPPTDQVPAAIDDKNREAFFRMPEVERFEVQTLVDDINALTQEAKDGASDWRKEEIGRELAEARAKLEGKVRVIEDVQQGIDARRETAAREKRVTTEAAIRFRNQVTTEYNAELFGMVDAFAQDLAPRLTYADSDTQLSQARNVLARVQNALGFNILDDGTLKDDPMAAHYAKQLADENIKFDFNKGRELLKAHYKATEKLEGLKARGAGDQAIEFATKAKNRIMFDIKTEQKQLLGQLSSKYVKSNGNALNKQIDEIKAKKQAVRTITNGKAHTKTAPKPIEQDIAAYNSRMAAVAAKNGDELYEQYQ